MTTVTPGARAGEATYLLGWALFELLDARGDAGDLVDGHPDGLLRLEKHLFVLR